MPLKLFLTKMTTKTELIENKALNDELRKRLQVSFNNYYHTLFAKFEETEFEFDDFDEWLNKQFSNNVGDHWIVSDNDFLTFSETNDCLVVYHLCAHSDIGKILLLKRLTKVNRKKRFVAAIRKADEKTIADLTQIGCKLIQNPLPKFSNKHYIGVEVPASCAMELSLLPNDLLIALFKE